MIRIYAAIAGLALVAAAFTYTRWDAVRDYRAKLDAARTGHIEDAREIENETRSDSDSTLLDCLRGGDC